MFSPRSTRFLCLGIASARFVNEIPQVVIVLMGKTMLNYRFYCPETMTTHHKAIRTSYSGQITFYWADKQMKYEAKQRYWWVLLPQNHTRTVLFAPSTKDLSQLQTSLLLPLTFQSWHGLLALPPQNRTLTVQSFAPDFSVLALLVGVASSKFETYSDCSVFALLAADFSVAAADFSVLAWLVGVASSNSYSDRSVFAPDFSVLALLVGVASSKFETCSDCSVFALLAADFSVAAADFSVLAWLVGVASSNSYSDRSVFAPDFSVLALLVGVASSKFETCSDCSVFALLAADFSVAAADFSVLAWLVGVASSKSYSDRSVFAPDFSVLALLVGVASSKFETYSDCSVFALLAADFSVAAADFSVLAWLVGVASSNSYSDRSVFAPDFSVLALLVGVASSKFETCSDCSVFALLAADFSVAAADFSVLAWLVGVASSNSYSDRSVFAPEFSVLALLVGVASSKFETCSDCSVFALLAADFSVAAADFSVLAWLVGVASSNSYSDRSVFAPDFSVLALLVGVASSKFETCSDCSVFALLAADLPDLSVLAWLVGVADVPDLGDLQERHLSRARG